jgi:hypothetical protein
MVVEITEERIYVAIILVLGVMQVVQWKKIQEMKNIIGELFDQIKILAMASGAKMEELERKIVRESGGGYQPTKKYHEIPEPNSLYLMIAGMIVSFYIARKKL